MNNLMEVYTHSLQLLKARHACLLEQISSYDKRVALLEEEIDELYETMRMMSPYVEESHD